MYETVTENVQINDRERKKFTMDKQKSKGMIIRAVSKGKAKGETSKN